VKNPIGALQYLLGELEGLKVRITSLESRITEIEARSDADCERFGRDIAFDRQRLARLETPPDPTPSQKDRAEILRALLAGNRGKMPVKEARQKMHLSKSQFSQLLSSMDGGIETKPSQLDKRQKVLILR
jgi:hypothetical protein